MLADATASDLSVDPLFPQASIVVTSGALYLSVGIGLVSPFEITADELSLESNITRLTDFESQGELSVRLPIAADIDGVSRDFVIIFQDNNIFDQKTANIKVDFSACIIEDIIGRLLSKTGSLA
eukprot:1152708-Ditylum_brightwellii.AAC.1